MYLSLKLLLVAHVLGPTLCMALIEDATDMDVELLPEESDTNAAYARPPRSPGFYDYHYGFGNHPRYGGPPGPPGPPGPRFGFGPPHGFGGHHHGFGNPYPFGNSHEFAEDSDECNRPKSGRGSHDHHHRLVPTPFHIPGRSPGFDSREQPVVFKPTPPAVFRHTPPAVTPPTPPKPTRAPRPTTTSRPATTARAIVISSTTEPGLEYDIDLRFGKD